MEILTTMIDFFKKGAEIALLLLLFPVIWPIYVVHDNLPCQRHVTYYDCAVAGILWVLGTILYALACFVSCEAYFGITFVHDAGYLGHVLMCIGVPLAIFIAPDVLYYIFKIIKNND